MREPAFWSHPAGVAPALLSPLAALYGAVVAWRMGRTSRAAAVPVLCIGNLTVGGAGKTPTAIAVARLLTAAGRRPFLLSRGYGGRLAGPVRVDLASHRADDIGDEPLLLARAAPTIVARDRVAGAAAAVAGGAGVIVMDDGFQNSALKKDFSIVAIDARRGIGNGKVFPAGPLRAPLAAQLARVHAMLLIGTGSGADAIAANAQARGLPIFHGRLVPEETVLGVLRDRPVLAFAGIGDPDKFFATLSEAGIDVRARVSFPDHHRIRRSEALDLINTAKREGLVAVATEKDAVRFAGRDDLKALADIVRPLPVHLAVEEEAAFRALLLARTG
jgi:tetraacyldisaccharide 4'-kinase